MAKPEFNPYAAPEFDVSLGSHAPDEVGVWRDGKLLVMTKDATLPDRCLKCNAPVPGRKIKRTLSWHAPGWYLLLLFNLIIYVIVAMIVRKTAKVFLPICDRHRKLRRRAILIGWLLAAAGVALFIAGGSVSGPGQGDQTAGLLFLGGIILLLVGIVYGVLASRLAVPKRIDKRYVWLQYVSPAFLAELPPWLP